VLGKLLDHVKDPKTFAAILKETFPGVLSGGLVNSPDR
jgi:hypothetical protein